MIEVKKMEEQINNTINRTGRMELTHDRVEMAPMVHNHNASFYKSLFPERNSSESKPLVIPATLDNWYRKIDFDKLLRWLIRKIWIPIALFIITTVSTYYIITLVHTFPTTYSGTVILLYQNNPTNQKDFMSINTVKDMIVMRKNCQGVKTLLSLDMTIDEIQEATTVTLSRNSNIIELTVEAETSAKAKEMVNTLAEVALGNNRNFYEFRAKSSLETYSEQVEKARKKANPAQNAFVKFKRDNNILDIDLAKKQLIDSISMYVSEVQNLKRQLLKQKSDLKLQKNTFEKLPQKISQKDDRILKQELASLQVRYSRLSEDYREKNPKLVQIKENMRRIRAQINGESGSSHDAELVPNPAIKQVEAQIRLREAEIVITNQKISDINQLIAEEKANLSLFPNLQQEYSKLEKKKVALEETVHVLEESAENATIDFVRPRTDFEIYELATNTIENPSHMRIVISGLSGSTFSMTVLVWIIITYFFNLKLSTEREISLNYTPPCLMVVPEFNAEDMTDITSPFRNHIEAMAEKIALHAKSDSKLSVAICSAHSNTTKSIIAYELSRFYARLGLRTVFLDFDNGPDGIFEQTHNIEDIIHHEDATDRLLEEQGTFEKLKLDQHANMHDCLKSLACNSFFERVKAKNDVVIIDAPGVLEGLHSCDIINMADHQLFSIQSGIHKKSLIDNALIKLQELRIRPIGIILNSVKRHN